MFFVKYFVQHESIIAKADLLLLMCWLKITFSFLTQFYNCTLSDKCGPNHCIIIFCDWTINQLFLDFYSILQSRQYCEFLNVKVVIFHLTKYSDR